MTFKHSTYLENTAIALTALMTGIMAGFFFTYSFNVNYALAALEGRMYAIVQSLLNQNVRHAVFFLFFFGSAALPVLTLILNKRHVRSVSFWFLLLAGLLYFFGVVVFTAQVNLPLNYYTESWNPNALPADWQETRQAWNRANGVRVFTASLSFFLYLLVLVMRASHRQKS
ncbi:MAG: DUF1772 domain-containing protein [Kamptonema sp. SIO4C4]|nr:DUF1772 domain-containing protein [Kamptonema sp. SIO4C4]